MQMPTRVKKLHSSSGMTLVEILVSMVILGLVIIAVFPLITQSLQVTNLSNTITTNLFSDQEEIEIVAVTRDGAYLEDGTFIPTASFPVIADDGNTILVPGMTVKKEKLVRFLADNLGSEFELFQVYEGYTETEAVLTIEDRSFTDDSDFEMTDKDGNSVSVDLEVVAGASITFTLPTDANRLTNLQSPYTITITTGGREASALLLVHLPRAVIANESGGLLIASSPTPSTWVSKSSSISSSNDINKVIFTGASEEEGRYTAVGDNGSIYVWKYGEAVFSKLTLSGVGTANLNSIISTGNGFLVVGNNGIILTSENGDSWTISTSNTTNNLYAVTWFEDRGEYICVGDHGTMLRSSNGQSWTSLSTPGYPRINTTGINNRRALQFSGDNAYMKTAVNPVTGSSSRTIFMVVRPTNNKNIHLMTMGSPDEYVTLRTNNNGRLSVQTNSSTYTSNLTLANNTTAVIACRYDASTNKMLLYQNGTASTELTGVNMDTGETTGALYLGSNFLFDYEHPLYFSGLIGEVFVFDRPLGTNRQSYSYWGSTRYYSSEMDIVHKYCSLKYGISLADSSINTTYYDIDWWTGTERLQNLNYSQWEDKCWPYNETDYPDFEVGELWLDGSDLPNTNGQQGYIWQDSSGSSNHAGTPALYAVAAGDKGELFAGGYHRSMMVYEDNGDLSEDASNLSNQLGPAIQYNVADMIFAKNRYISLLNDNLDPDGDNSYIATMNRNGSNSHDRRASNYNLNDIARYQAGQALLVVGDHGTILLSTNNGASWTNIGTGSSRLVAGCLR